MVLDPAVCKIVGSAYVGSNLTPATEKALLYKEKYDR